MLSIEPNNVSHIEVWNYLLGGVAPRPIAFVSTISKEGIPNLSPFSFFNAFGSNPPVIAFSPSRRGRDNTLKDTYNNLIETKECVVNTVTYQMLHQMNLSSCEYPPEIDEFVKSGLTPIDSDIVKPKRVKESPFQMECRLMQMIELGGKSGSGNLAICEVVKFHIAEYILDENGRIDPLKINHVGRNGGQWYTVCNANSLIKVPKPAEIKGIGFDNLPDFMKSSFIYTANNLGRFALVDKIPDPEEAKRFVESYPIIESDEYAFNMFMSCGDYKSMLSSAKYLLIKGNSKSRILFELTAKCAVENNEIDFAWNVALFASTI